MGPETFVRLPDKSKIGETREDAETWIAPKTLGVTKVIYNGYHNTITKESEGHRGHDHVAVHDEGILVILEQTPHGIW